MKRSQTGLNYLQQEYCLDIHDHTPTSRGQAFLWGGTALGVVLMVILYTHGFGLLASHGAPAEPDMGPQHQGDTVSVPEGSSLRTRIEVQPVVAEPVSAQRAVPGIVESDPAVTETVLTPLGGRVEELRVAPGDRVTRGQVIAVIDSPDLAQAYDDDTKAADAAALTQKTLSRQEQQLAIGAIADRDLDQARSDNNQAQAELTRTRARLSALGVTPEGRSHPSRLEVRAPVSGSVTALNVARGNMINDATQPIMSLADLGTVWVTALVAEQDLVGVSKGQDAQVTISAYPGRALQGKVFSVSDVLEPDSRREKVRIAFANPDYALKPNMFATVTLLGAQRPQIVVPTSALLMNNDRTTVFVATAPWTFKRRAVTVQLREGTTAVVESGLEAGEKVVIKGGILLND